MTDNLATGNGGGLAIETDPGVLNSVTGGEISQNRAESTFDGGGGIYIDDADLVLTGPRSLPLNPKKGTCTKSGFRGQASEPSW